MDTTKAKRIARDAVICAAGIAGYTAALDAHHLSALERYPAGGAGLAVFCVAGLNAIKSLKVRTQNVFWSVYDVGAGAYFASELGLQASQGKSAGTLAVYSGITGLFGWLSVDQIKKLKRGD